MAALSFDLAEAPSTPPTRHYELRLKTRSLEAIKERKTPHESRSLAEVTRSARSVRVLTKSSV